MTPSPHPPGDLCGRLGCKIKPAKIVKRIPNGSVISVIVPNVTNRATPETDVALHWMGLTLTPNEKTALIDAVLNDFHALRATVTTSEPNPPACAEC